MIENKFFYETGEYKEGSIPSECVKECTVPGRDAYIHVDYWASKLDFDCNPDQARKYLREYGAWSDIELEDHEQNIRRVLWLACGDIEENGIFYGLIH